MTSTQRPVGQADSRRIVIITGGNSGLGYQAACALAKTRKWHIVIASRNDTAGAEAAASLVRRFRASAEALHLDLASLASVRAFAARLAATSSQRPPVHALVCNAGTQTVSGLTLTTDGFESTFGVNHLGHFLLVNLMVPLLARPARVVFVSSGTHDPADLGSRAMGMNPPRLRSARQMAFPGEDPGPLPQTAQGRGREAYTTSKLCNLLTSNEFARRHASPSEAITFNAYDPGLMPGTGLARDSSVIQRLVWHYLLPALTLFVPEIRRPATSGKHLARLISDPRLGGVTGRYFAGGGEKTPSALARDTAAASRLWRESAALVGLHDADSSRSGSYRVAALAGTP